MYILYHKLKAHCKGWGHLVESFTCQMRIQMFNPRSRDISTSCYYILATCYLVNYAGLDKGEPLG